MGTTTQVLAFLGSPRKGGNKVISVSVPGEFGCHVLRKKAKP